MTRSLTPSDALATDAHSPESDGSAAALIVPDAHLLFSADYKRSGANLILTGTEGERFTILDYFRHKKLPDLITPDGATFSANLLKS